MYVCCLFVFMMIINSLLYTSIMMFSAFLLIISSLLVVFLTILFIAKLFDFDAWKTKIKRTEANEMLYQESTLDIMFILK